MKKIRYRIIGSTKHMSTNIQGVLNHTKKGRLTFINDEDGNPMPDQLARHALNNLLIQGHAVIPCGDCNRFDKVKGCPGHIYSIMPNEEAMAKIESEYSLYKEKTNPLKST